LFFVLGTYKLVFGKDTSALTQHNYSVDINKISNNFLFVFLIFFLIKNTLAILL